MARILAKVKEAVRYIFSLLIVIVAVAALTPFAGEINPTTVALALLLSILLIATLFGSRQALAASILAMLCFNFFFLPPFYTFHIADKENWIAFAAFMITAFVAGQLSTYARRQADESERRRVRIEGLYKDLQDAFEQASQAEALRRSEKLKSALLDAITHDLRTPLTSIKASVTTLMESKNSQLLNEEDETEFLQIINEESDRLNRFIEGMVGLAKIEANALHLRKSWTTVQEMLNMAIDRAQNQLTEFHIRMELERELPSIFVDASSVSEVLFLLLDNAAKYSPKGSRIRISAKQKPEEGQVVVSIEDEGKGIAESDREKVFRKFTRVAPDKAPSTGDGLGLGLAIAKGIIESQGGHIWNERGEDDYVTRFAFTLPIEEKGTNL